MIFFLFLLLNQAAQVHEQDTESVGSWALEDGQPNSDTNESFIDELGIDFQPSETSDNADDEALEAGNPTSEIENESMPQAEMTNSELLERNENLQQRVRELEQLLQQRAQNEEDGEALAQRQEEATASSTQEEIADTSRDEEIARELQDEVNAEEQQTEASDATVQRLAAAESTNRDAEIAREVVYALLSVSPCQPIEQQIASCILREADECKIKMCEEVQFLARETSRIAADEVAPFVEHNAKEVARIAKDEVAPFVEHKAKEMERIAAPIIRDLGKLRFW